VLHRQFSPRGLADFLFSFMSDENRQDEAGKFTVCEPRQGVVVYGSPCGGVVIKSGDDLIERGQSVYIPADCIDDLINAIDAARRCFE